MKQYLRSQRGEFSILSILVGTAIMVVVGGAMYGLIGNIMRINATQNLESEVESIRRMLLGRTVCSKTTPPTPPPANVGFCDDHSNINAPIKLYNSKIAPNDVLIDNSTNGTQIGSLRLKAWCNPATRSIIVQAAKVTSIVGGVQQYAQDPSDPTKSLNWSHPKLRVIDNYRGFCADFLAAVDPPASGSGSSSSSGLTIVSSTGASTSDPGCSNPRSATATCPTGSKVISGGVRCGHTSNNQNTELVASIPISDTQWRGVCCDSDSIQVSATCLQAP